MGIYIYVYICTKQSKLKGSVRLHDTTLPPHHTTQLGRADGSRIPNRHQKKSIMLAQVVVVYSFKFPMMMMMID